MKLRKKVALIITDGLGYNKDNFYNAFYNATTPFYDYMFKNVPFSYIKTSGESVGLPSGQMGNSEVGHLTMGSGRVLKQNMVRVSTALDDGSLSRNKNLLEFIEKSRNIHLVALLSDGGVHSSLDHIVGLLKILADKIDKKNKIFIHAITDGRDVLTTKSLEYLSRLEPFLSESIKIASLSGRFYAMDRDNRWDRIKKAYDQIALAKKKSNISPALYIKKFHANNITDEFIIPTSFSGYGGFINGDGVLFINFRSDRMRQLASSIGLFDFSCFSREKVYKVNILTMTKYDKTFNFPVLFEPQKIQNTLPYVISKNSLTQFHISETEKYAHVSFFFNGGIEEPLDGETRILIPSSKIRTYNLAPNMRSKEIADLIIKAMKQEYDFIVANFPNPDMVGHTGDYYATMKAIEAVDSSLSKIFKASKRQNYSLVITSDHGNAEKMRDKSGNILTNHTNFDVFCFIVDKDVSHVRCGALNNIAPTLLKLMGVNIPKEMSGALI